MNHKFRNKITRKKEADVFKRDCNGVGFRAEPAQLRGYLGI